jgi:hypothetical protein
VSGTETWEYIAQAAAEYAQSDPADDRFYEPMLYLLNRASSEAAVEFARLTKDGVPEAAARMAVQLSMEHSVAMTAAMGILDADYEEWRKTGSATLDYSGYTP